MTEILCPGGGLLLLAAANIALGSIRAVLRREWDRSIFLRGIFKSAVTVGALLAVFAAGMLNPDLIVIEAGGRSVGLVEAVRLLLIGGYAYYAKETLKNLKETLHTGSRGEEDAEKKEREKKDG